MVSSSEITRWPFCVDSFGGSQIIEYINTGRPAFGLFVPAPSYPPVQMTFDRSGILVSLPWLQLGLCLGLSLPPASFLVSWAYPVHSENIPMLKPMLLFFLVNKPCEYPMLNHHAWFTAATWQAPHPFCAKTGHHLYFFLTGADNESQLQGERPRTVIHHQLWRVDLMRSGQLFTTQSISWLMSSIVDHEIIYY